MLNNVDGLVEELRDCVYERGGLKFIAHPLVHGILWQPEVMNCMLEQKKKLLAEHRQKKKWTSFVFLHERPYRFAVFQKIAHNVKSPKEYWELVGNVWEDSENIWQHKDEWKAVWKKKTTSTKFAMDDEERKVFKRLPPTVTTYRGITQNTFAELTLDQIIHEELINPGVSWTLEYEKAEWFAKRFSRRGVILKTIIDKKAIVAYKDGRNEKEVIVPSVNSNMDVMVL